LASEIAKHDASYYLDADPEITDAAYDRLRVRLEAIERAHPNVATKYSSPSFRVGAAPPQSAAAAKLPHNPPAKHVVPMLSLSNVFSEKEAFEWETRIRRALGGERRDDGRDGEFGDRRMETDSRTDVSERSDERLVVFVAEPKIDGASASLTYENGVLVRCVSRGDGLVGEDVTRQLESCSGIPKTLSGSGRRGGDHPFPRVLEIRGEVCVADADFESVNERRAAFGLLPFKNPRNAVAGAMRRLDFSNSEDGAEVLPMRFLTYAYGAVSDIDGADSSTEIAAAAALPWRTHREFKEYATRVGLTVAPTLASGPGVASVLPALAELAAAGNEGRKKLGYAVDGVVYKVDDARVQLRLGADARAPRWATAHKFPAAFGVTRLQAVEIQVGRTGALTPVAVLDPPIDLGGASVRRATLHNFFDIERKSLRIGKRVVVERAGDVIPRVVGLDPNDPDDEFGDGSGKITPPRACPSCGSPAEAASLSGSPDAAPAAFAAVLRCTGGLRCPAQAIERIAHFVSRDALDVPGLAKSQIRRMHESGVIATPADLFTLRDRYGGVFDSAGGAARRGTVSDAEKRALGGAPDDRQIDATPSLPACWVYSSGKNAGSMKLSVVKLFDALDFVSNSGVPLHRFLFSLGIPHVGKETAKALARRYGTFDAFREAFRDAVRIEADSCVSDDANGGPRADARNRMGAIDAESVGPAAASAARAFFAEKPNAAMVDALSRSLTIVDDDSQRDAQSSVSTLGGSSLEEPRARGPLVGKKVVVTGTLPTATRSEAFSAVSRAGGVAQRAVTAATDFLVLGEGAGQRKARDAAAKGVRVIDAETFLRMLRGEEV
jgi:DNA ligase (NAD+)